jgi:hypothetical protein
MKDRKRTDLQNIAMLDKVMLYTLYTGNTTRVQVRMEMADTVDGELLRKAVGSNLKIYTNFAKKVVVCKNEFYYAENHNEMPVFAEDGKVRRLCSADTNQYAFYITYEENRLKWVFTHVAADGTGMYMFLDSVIRTYLRDRYPGEYEFDEAAQFAASPFEDIPEPLDHFEEVHLKQKKNNAYYFRPCKTGENDVRSYVKMPEEKVVELSRSLGITPVGLFAAVFTRAARNVYGIEDSRIIADVIVDLRRRSGIYPLRNFTGVSYIDMSTDELMPELADDCRTAGRKLAEALDSGYYHLDLFDSLLGMYRKIPGSLKTKYAVAKRLIGDAGKGYVSYHVSYMNQPQQTEWYLSKVKDLIFSVYPSSIDAPYIVIISQNGVMTWDISGLPDRDVILPEVARLLGLLGISCEITEMRETCEDYFDLDAIEQVE